LGSHSSEQIDNSTGNKIKGPILKLSSPFVMFRANLFNKNDN